MQLSVRHQHVYTRPYRVIQPAMQPDVKSKKISPRYPGETATARGRLNSSSEGCLHDHNTHTRKDICTQKKCTQKKCTQKKCKHRHTFLPVQVGEVHWSNADQKSRDARAQAAPIACHSRTKSVTHLTLTLSLNPLHPFKLQPIPSSPHLLMLSLNPLQPFQLHPIASTLIPS